MANKIDPILVYLRERLRFFPWMLIPIILLVLGHSGAKYEYKLIYPLLWGVFFFRVFDDIFCFDYDSKLKMKAYHQYPRRDLVLVMLVFLFLYLSSVFMIFGPEVLTLNLAFIFISVCAYLLFRKSKLILYVSQFKYFLLLFMVAHYTAETNYVWVVLGGLYFLIREHLKDFVRININMAQYFVFSILLGLKLFFRFLV